MNAKPQLVPDLTGCATLGRGIEGEPQGEALTLAACLDKRGTDAGYQRHRAAKERACDDCRAVASQRLRDWKEANPERFKRSHRNAKLKKLFGITHDQYDQMLVEQGGCCAICHTEQSQDGKSFAVDHDHVTLKVRGLLCLNCNVTLGKMADSPELLRCAARYLEERS